MTFFECPMKFESGNWRGQSAFTFETLQQTIGKLAFRQALIAFVCQPEFAARVRDMIVSSDLGFFGEGIAVEAFTDDTQPEPILAFFDRDALREHMARNRVCSTPGCGARCVRWHSYADGCFYCEPCADRITAASPNLPGFNDCQFVKI